MLSLLIALPIVAALPLPFVSRRDTRLLRAWTLAAMLAELALAAWLFVGFAPGTAEAQFVEVVSWVPALGISYHVGLDGISLLLVGLTALLAPVALLGGWEAQRERTKEFCLLLLLLEGPVVGTFVARDLLLFFVFWEAMLVPMIFLIGICGGPRRGYAALKFFLFTAAGSVLMFVAILTLYALNLRGGAPASFDLAALARTPLAAQTELLLFLAFALAFAIKMPLFPFHSWLPDAYRQSPLPALVFATMLVKVGAYGLLRFGFGLFPGAAAALAPALAVLALIGILYAGCIAFGQRDVVLLLAYSSMAHMGFIGLGLVTGTLQGVQGAVIQMVNHGLSAGLLFFVVAVVADRLGTTELADWRGLAARLPVLTALMLVGAFAYLGLPGLNGFVGEVLILLGAVQAWPLLAALASLGIVVAAIYVLWLVRQAWHGPAAGLPPLPDLRWHEGLALAPLVVLIVWIGVAPGAFLSRSEPAARALVARLSAAGTGPAEPVRPVWLARGEVMRLPWFTPSAKPPPIAPTGRPQGDEKGGTRSALPVPRHGESPVATFPQRDGGSPEVAGGDLRNQPGTAWGRAPLAAISRQSADLAAARQESMPGGAASPAARAAARWPGPVGALHEGRSGG